MTGPHKQEAIMRKQDNKEDEAVAEICAIIE